MRLTEIKNTKDNQDVKGMIKTVVMSGNGIFEEEESWLGMSRKKVSDYKIPSYPEIQEEVILKEDYNFTKIPLKAIQCVMLWYKNITLKTNNEAQVNFYYIHNDKTTINIDDEVLTIEDLKDINGFKFWNDKIFSYTPLQTNSGASTSVDSEDLFYNELNKKFGMYLETHSHNSMNAFKSTTDKNNSENDCIQLVFGKLNSNLIEMFSWCTVRGVQKDGLSYEELSKFIELPEISKENQGCFYFDSNINEDFEYILNDWDNQIVKLSKSNYVSGYHTSNYFIEDSYFGFDFKKSYFLSKESYSMSFSEKFEIAITELMEENEDIYFILNSYKKGFEHNERTSKYNNIQIDDIKKEILESLSLLTMI